MHFLLNLFSKISTLRNSIPGELLQLIELDDIGLHDLFILLFASFWWVVLKVFIWGGCMNFFLFIEDISDVEFPRDFSSTFLSTYRSIYFLNKPKKDIFIINYYTRKSIYFLAHHQYKLSYNYIKYHFLLSFLILSLILPSNY